MTCLSKKRGRIDYKYLKKTNLFCDNTTISPLLPSACGCVQKEKMMKARTNITNNNNTNNKYSIVPEEEGDLLLHHTTTTTTTITNDMILKGIYWITSSLCLYMIIWILLFPGSWLIGRSKLHNDFVIPLLEKNSVVPKEITLKYAGHTLVQMTHILPGVLWASIIPFQLLKSKTLHSSLSYSKTESYYHHQQQQQQKSSSSSSSISFFLFLRHHHRFMGYIFLICSLLMSIGIGIILQRKLGFEHQFVDLPPLQQSNEPFLLLGGIWFAITSCYAIHKARKHQYIQHQIWIIRHISSGLWIAIQRLLLTTIAPICYSRPYSREVQRNVFTLTGQIAMILSFLMGEYTIYLLNKQRNEKEEKQRRNNTPPPPPLNKKQHKA